MTVRVHETTQLVERARAAYDDATRGDFRSSIELLSSLRTSEPAVAQAWAVVLDAQHWHAEPDAGRMPESQDCAHFREADTAAREAAALACVEGAKSAVLGHDVEQLRGWTDLAAGLAKGCESSWLSCWITLIKAWLALAEGDAGGAAQLARQANAVASENHIAPARIEATVIQAYAAERQGDLEQATSAARTAVRMARTEDVPQWQYLAGVALARMRRLSGMPHLTARILRPMLKVAPRSWHAWIAWEALMAGALSLGEGVELSDADDPAGSTRALQRALKSAESGDVEGFASAAASLDDTARWSSHAEDADLVLLALDATRPLPNGSPLEAWCVSHEPTPPDAIRGLCIDLATDPGDPGPAAFVIAGPGGPRGYHTPRRIAGLAEPLLSGEAKIERIRGKFERNLTTLATIALAGPAGIDRAELFRMVYGFEYEPEPYRGLVNSLIHRARQVLGEHGSLITEGDVYRLEFNHALVIPDPRVGQSVEELVLRVIARTNASTTKTTAENLGAPLRTIQRAVKRLVDDGGLVAERDGKLFLYDVEDTTFSEPTKWDIT